MLNSFRILKNVTKSFPKFRSISRFYINIESKTHIPSSCRTISIRHFSLSPLSKCSNATYEHSPDQKTLGKITPKLFLAFTCKKCNTRLEKYISKTAYSCCCCCRCLSLLRCDKCEENHLIADNLGWFPDLKSMRNIEDIMASKGETVKKSLDCYEIKEK